MSIYFITMLNFSKLSPFTFSVTFNFTSVDFIVALIFSKCHLFIVALNLLSVNFIVALNFQNYVRVSVCFSV
jgi:hypothetical protein